MLEVELHHRFSGFRLDVAFTGPLSGITALFGASGCGKTTIVNAIAGLLRAEAGRIAFGGEVLFDATRRINLPARRRRIGYVFQEPRLFPHLSVENNLLYGWRRVRTRDPRIDRDSVIDLLGLASLLTRRPATLSGGEKQRVGLGRALLAQPRLLLMDEPLAALDQDRKAEIIPYIERLRDGFGLPVIYVSHAIEEVARLADHLVLLDRGRVTAAGPVVDIMADLDLLDHVDAFEGGAVVAVEVTGHDERFQLTRLRFAGGELVVPRIAAAVGDRLRARIRARDVMLALDRPNGISAINVLPAEVSGVRLEPSPFAEVQVRVGTVPLVARITRHSASRLDVARGRRLFVVIKSVAIDRGSLALPQRR
ncbi:MAG: molybdenum ABC transporter ATP-binding protein [Rhodospirillales bacterium]